VEKIHIWPKETTETDEHVTSGFTLEESCNECKSLWYRLPVKFSPYITKSCDPFVLSVLFKAMSLPADLVVHGEVSPSLLCNLEEFQAAWTSWKPTHYARIEIHADVERECLKSDNSDAVMAFSGGVDSCFTAWRYRKVNGELFPYSLKAGLFIHGLEIPVKHELTFENAAAKTRMMLDSLGMDMILMATNQRTIHQPMTDSQAAFMASCLMLLQEKFSAGILAGSHNYKNLNFPYGTNPLTDPMLSSKSFSILYDGARFSRIEKIARLRDWTEGVQNLRVCMGREAAERNNNCCRCEKCIRTILEFRILGLGLPPCFNQDVTNRQILTMKYRDMDEIEFYDEILAIAENHKKSDTWVKSLKLSKSMNRIRLKAEQYPPYIRMYDGLRRIKRMIRNR